MNSVTVKLITHDELTPEKEGDNNELAM